MHLHMSTWSRVAPSYPARRRTCRPAMNRTFFVMTKSSLPTLRAHDPGSIVSSCAAVAVSLFVSGGLFMIMR